MSKEHPYTFNARPGGRAAIVRARVLQAARELYAGGDNSPNLTEIALKAGVQRSTVYRRWGNGEAVLLDAVGEAIQASVPIPKSGSLKDDLLSLARATHALHQTEDGRRLIAMLHGASETVKRRFWHQRYTALSDIFTRAASQQAPRAHREWEFSLDILIAPWFFCLWGKGTSWSLEAAEATIAMVCDDFSRAQSPAYRDAE